MQVDPLPQVSHIPRSFIGNTSNVILVDEQGCRFLARVHLLDVNHRTVGNASDLIKPLTAFALQIIGSFWLAAQEKIDGEDHARDDQYQTIEAKWNHNCGRDGASANRIRPEAKSGKMQSWGTPSFEAITTRQRGA